MMKRHEGQRVLGGVWLSLSLSLTLAVLPLGAEGSSRRERLAWAAQAKVLWDQKNFAEAAQWLEKAVAPGASKNDLAQWWPILGRCYENVGNYQKALAAYQEALKLKPRHVDRMVDLARIYDRTDLNRSAIDLYEEVLDRARDRPDVIYALANLYFRSGRLDRARDYADRAVRQEPQDLSAQKLMARIEEAQGDLAGSAHRWEGILARQPDAGGYFHLGRLWVRQSEYELAETAFARAEGLGLSTAPFHFHRGLVRWYQGKEESAERAWRKALRLDPEYVPAQFFLAVQDYRNGDVREALDLMRQAEKKAGSPYIKDLIRDFQAAAGGSSKAGPS
jgi:tetratricopeptide (TPR) repeat protein